MSTLITNIFGSDSITHIFTSFLTSAIILTITFILSMLTEDILGFIAKLLFKNKDENVRSAFKASFYKPLTIFIKIIGIYFALSAFPLNRVAKVPLVAFMKTVVRISLILMVSISSQNMVTSIPRLADNIGDKLGGVNQTLVTFFTKIVKALIIVFTAVIIVEEFGYDVTSLITGLGLGGLTFALAAQDIASNFMAGITILTDHPFGVGDWITVAGLEGIVEEINFRSCRIRTFDNALITVPNSKINNDSVTNWSKMQYRKTNIIIGLLYSTTRETLQEVINDIHSELSKFEEIKTDSLVVRFNEFSASSLDVKISYNSFPIPAPEHLALREKVNLKIMEVVERHDTDFAYNTVTVVNG